MKKLTKSLLILALCVSLCGCAPLQATLADSFESAYGDEGKSYEEHLAYYQAEWDMLFGDLGKLLGIAADEAEKLVKDTVEQAVEEVISDNSVDWENVAKEKVTLANIKDENGYTDYYNNRFSKGQCTWYAFGRFSEVTEINDLGVSGDAKTWLDNCYDERVYVERDLANIKAPAIAVDYKTTDSGHPGHVTFIEHVTYDEQGNPIDVYFTESNWDSNNAYNENTDAIVKKLPYSKFINRGHHKVIGFIIPE